MSKVTFVTAFTKKYAPFAKVFFASVRDKVPYADIVCETINFKQEFPVLETKSVSYKARSKFDLARFAFCRHADLCKRVRKERDGVIICCNADMLINRPLDWLLQKFERYDVAVFTRDGERCLNGFFVVNDTSGGRVFVNKYAEVCSLGYLHVIDQVAFSAVLICRDDISLLPLQQKYCDYECKESSFVWAPKGTTLNASYEKKVKEVLGNVPDKSRIEISHGVEVEKKKKPAQKPPKKKSRRKKHRKSRRRLLKKIIKKELEKHNESLRHSSIKP